MQVRAIFATAAVLSLFGCASQQPLENPGLEGTQWRLVSVNGPDLVVPKQPPIELRFHDSRVNFHACNAMSGRYSQQGHHIVVAKGFVGTRMGCDAPLMAIDAAASALFQRGVDFTLYDSTLVLESQGERWAFQREASLPAQLAEQIDN